MKMGFLVFYNVCVPDLTCLHICWCGVYRTKKGLISLPLTEISKSVQINYREPKKWMYFLLTIALTIELCRGVQGF